MFDTCAQQPGKLPTIGYLGSSTAAAMSRWNPAFLQRRPLSHISPRISPDWAKTGGARISCCWKRTGPSRRRKFKSICLDIAPIGGKNCVTFQTNDNGLGARLVQKRADDRIQELQANINRLDRMRAAVSRALDLSSQ